jgi:hypothetical protein
MSISLLEALNLNLEQAKAVLANKPGVLEPVYWHRLINAYFVPGKRNNALVLCKDGDGVWRSSTRYNKELEDPLLFVPLVQIEEAVQESAPF